MEFETDMAQEYALAQNVPNPFHRLTRIFYSIQEANFISLKIYDQSGREIQTLVKGYQDRGAYSVELDAKELSGGIYFYRHQAGSDFMETRKMVLIRKQP